MLVTAAKKRLVPRKIERNSHTSIVGGRNKWRSRDEVGENFDELRDEMN